MRLLRVIAVLVILLLGGLTGYAYFGDMQADPQETRLPVELDLGSAPVPAAVPAEAPAPAAPVAAAPEAPTNTGQNELD